jgi:hypothetical protein
MFISHSTFQHDSDSTYKIHYWQYLVMGSKLGVVIDWIELIGLIGWLIDWQGDLELNLVIEAFSRYKNLLRVEQSGVRNPVEAEFSGPVQTVPKIHPALRTLVIGSFPGDKTAGAWRWPPNVF